MEEASSSDILEGEIVGIRFGLATNHQISTSGGLAERLFGVCCEEASHISIRERASDGASYLELKLPSRSRLQADCWKFLERYH